MDRPTQLRRPIIMGRKDVLPIGIKAGALESVISGYRRVVPCVSTVC